MALLAGVAFVSFLPVLKVGKYEVCLQRSVIRIRFAQEKMRKKANVANQPLSLVRSGSS